MYRQVLLNNNDRKYHYILWRASPDLELRTYQLNTITYGTASAPYRAVRSLHYLADKCMDELPVGASVVKSSFYVDDMLCGADSIDALRTVKSQVSAVLERGSFPLSKWHSNHVDFRECQTSKELNFTEDLVTLGITWDQLEDVFLFTFAPKEIHTAVTKRTILSIASSLFDPLGLLAPLLITSKIVLQELWLLKLDWDESVPQNLQHAWSKCLSVRYQRSRCLVIVNSQTHAISKFTAFATHRFEHMVVLCTCALKAQMEILLFTC
ncbi:PREDICTED: uncharacterized protein LOC108367719 [Rhagoletis zephyria]|uniref:uncharacterized protein LOC108367719 n=1 Tax=Rhagoletis zephyria TaxID=28612 RepID=UPI0008115933|nr:PREDICTED: uncharacterized protein LOC108367719 [Rhagoletis zephyria]